MRFGTVFGGAVIALLTARALGLIGHGRFTRLLPFPWIWLGWILVETGMRQAVAIVPLLPGIFFCLWCWPVIAERPMSRRRTLIAAATVASASAVWFCISWNYGVRYQGMRYTTTTALASVLFAVVIGGLLIVSRRRAASSAYSLAVNFLVFAWAVTYAFPYLGELP